MLCRAFCLAAVALLSVVDAQGEGNGGLKHRPTAEPLALGSRAVLQPAIAGAPQVTPAPKPLYRDPVYDGAADPVVIWNPTVQRWWMFYTNRRANVPGLSGIAWVHGTAIGIAESADGGATWKRLGDAKIEVPASVGGAEPTYWAPDVITAPDGVHHMYLTVVPGVFETWQHPRVIAHLTSRDLLTWRYQSTLSLASDRVIDAGVFPLSDGRWRMWYNNERDGKSIYFADSPDLTSWEDRGKVTSINARGEGPYVFRWKGRAWMLVDTWKGLGVYRSDDLETWTQQPSLLLDQPGTGADDAVNGGHAGVVVSGGRAYCFYFTHPGRAGTITPQDKDSLELRRSSIQVVELREQDGWLTADRDAPTELRLAPPVARLAQNVSASLPLPGSGTTVDGIADAAFAGSSVNVVANVRQTLFTHGETQFAGFYDAAGFMVLARRQVPPAPAGTRASAWEQLQSEHQGNVADAHNSISLVVDGDGYVHVAWDHHGNPLNYARGKAPGSLELLPKQKMTGEREGQVTYPQFFRTRDGDLFFLYRDGRSGKGALVLNHYATKTRNWTQVQPNLVDGEGVRSPYWGMDVDAKGVLHLSWIWRDSSDVATNHDLCYARSADGGRTWTTSTGAALALPITAATAEYAVRIPPRSNLMNSPVVETDAEGHPCLMSYWSPTPDAPPQFHVVSNRWRPPLHPSTGASVGADAQDVGGSASETNWLVTPIDHPRAVFSLAGAGTKRPPMSRGVLLLQGAGAQTRAHLVYRDDRRGGKVLAVSSAAGLHPPWHVTELTSGAVGAWEPSYDPSAWAQDATFSTLLQQVEQRDGNDANAAAVPAQPIGVLSWKPLLP